MLKLNNPCFSQQILKNTPGLVFWKDKNLRYLGCNLNFAKAAGLCDPEELIGHSDYKFPWKRFADGYREHDKRAFKGEVFDRFELFQTHDKTIMTVHVNKYPLYNHSNEIIAVVGYTRILSIAIPSTESQPIEKTKTTNALSPYIEADELWLKTNFKGVTLRQAQCLFYLIRGHSQMEIAEKLGISHRTVETHFNGLKAKFLCFNRADLIHKAIAYGFLNVLPKGCQPF